MQLHKSPHKVHSTAKVPPYSPNKIKLSYTYNTEPQCSQICCTIFATFSRQVITDGDSRLPPTPEIPRGARRFHLTFPAFLLLLDFVHIPVPVLDLHVVLTIKGNITSFNFSTPSKAFKLFQANMHVPLYFILPTKSPTDEVREAGVWFIDLPNLRPEYTIYFKPMIKFGSSICLMDFIAII